MLTHALVYLGNRVPDLKHFTSGAFILVETTPIDYHSTVVGLEDLGWEVRDCLKYHSESETLQFALLRKPFKGSVANQVLTVGTGVLNIDGSRIATENDEHADWKPSTFSNRSGSDLSQSHIAGSNDERHREAQLASIAKLKEMGRYPSNLLLENNSTIESQFPEGSYNIPSTYQSDTTNGTVFSSTIIGKHPKGHHRTAFGDTGSAARFFRQFSSRSELNDYLLTLIRPAEKLEVDS